jgi:hypothetical protein
MESCDNGRKCSKCDHVITDFRGMSDWQIAVKHAISNEKICGLYGKHTLGGSKSNEKGNQIGKMAIVPSLLSLLLSSTHVNAQSTNTDVQELIEFTSHGMSITGLEVIKEKGPNQTKSYNDSLKIVRGFLFDSANEVIIGGNIIIQGTSRGTVTDIDGSFSLDLTEEFEDEQMVTLIVAYLGYGKKTIEININQFDEISELTLNPIIIEQDLMLTSFDVRRESLPKRIWRSITSIFRKKR